MPKVFKSFLGSGADDYVFRPASELEIETEPPEETVRPEDMPEDTVPPAGAAAEAADAAPDEPAAADPLAFAKVQAEAILADAEREAEQYRERLRAELEEQVNT